MLTTSTPPDGRLYQVGRCHGGGYRNTEDIAIQGCQKNADRGAGMKGGGVNRLGRLSKFWLESDESQECSESVPTGAALWRW